MSEPAIRLNLLQSRTILVASFPSQCLVQSMLIFNKTCVEGQLQRKICTRCIYKKYIQSWCKYNKRALGPKLLFLCAQMGIHSVLPEPLKPKSVRDSSVLKLKDDMFHLYIITWNGSRFLQRSGKACFSSQNSLTLMTCLSLYFFVK